MAVITPIVEMPEPVAGGVRKDGSHRRRADVSCAAGHGLQVGDMVRVEIDWARRYVLMRLYFVAELVLEMVCYRWLEIEKISAHIGAEKARVDFISAENLAPFLSELAAEVQALIDADCPITSAFADDSL